MRTFDFAPFYRSTVGFDRVFTTLDQLVGVDGSVPSYPPYNIARTDENAYRISVAVAGFTDADLSIEAKENMLTIHGEKQTNDEEKTGDVLYQVRQTKSRISVLILGRPGRRDRHRQ
jgi:molecular chaperone IbpA